MLNTVQSLIEFHRPNIPLPTVYQGLALLMVFNWKKKCVLSPFLSKCTPGCVQSLQLLLQSCVYCAHSQHTEPMWFLQWPSKHCDKTELWKLNWTLCNCLRGSTHYGLSATSQTADRWMAPRISSSGVRRADPSIAAHNKETDVNQSAA